MKYKGYLIKKAGDNYRVALPCGQWLFNDYSANATTAKKWIDWHLFDKRERLQAGKGAQ